VLDLATDCDFNILSEKNPIKGFRCVREDLNAFFSEDALRYKNELLGITYFFTVKNSEKAICAYTLSNDSIQVHTLSGSRKKTVEADIPRSKLMKSYPATLIGRLGVSEEFSNGGIGRQLMNHIKASCILEDGNRCRFITVDAYNENDVIGYYTAMGFSMLFSSEEQEREYYKRKHLKTRFMKFDLMPLYRVLG